MNPLNHDKWIISVFLDVPILKCRCFRKIPKEEEKNGSINKFLMEIPSQNVKKLAFFNENIPLIVVSMETICMVKSQDAQIYLTTTSPFEN